MRGDPRTDAERLEDVEDQVYRQGTLLAILLTGVVLLAVALFRKGVLAPADLLNAADG
jgi:hypothetical protein